MHLETSRTPSRAPSAPAPSAAPPCPRRGATLPSRALGALLTLLLALAAPALAPARAQAFDADGFYLQCLRQEANGDLDTARESCLTALRADPGLVDAELALARIDLARGDAGVAEARLRGLADRVDDAEPLVLLAEAALAQDRYAEAEARLAEAEERLRERYSSELAGRLAFARGRLMEARGRYDEALAAYRVAIEVDALSVRDRLADARLRLELGDAAGARDGLLDWERLGGARTDAEVRSLLGRAFWALGERERAASALEDAVRLRPARDVEEGAADLRALAVVYYADGDFASGGLALRQALERENLVRTLVLPALPWLALLLVLMAVHLLAESRIESRTSLEVVEGPQLWTLGRAYGILLVSALLAAAATTTYGILVQGDPLAFLAPVLRDDARAVFLLALSLLLAASAADRARRNGFDAAEVLFGDASRVTTGLALGLLLLAATVAWYAYAPAALGRPTLDLSAPSALVVAAAALLPLSELFFRSFVLPAAETRYDAVAAVIVSAALGALALGTPVPLLAAIGVALAESVRRVRHGSVAFAAQAVVQIGLLLGASFLPWVRHLFHG